VVKRGSGVPAVIAAPMVLGAVGAVLAVTPALAAAQPGSVAARATAATPRVFAFLSRADGLELTRLEQIGRRISVLAPNWYELDVDSGRVRAPSGEDDVVDAAARAGVPLWPVVNARTGGSAAITDSSTRERLARRVARIAAQPRHAGLTLDVEELLPSQRAAYTAFVRRVSKLVRARGKGLAVYAPRPRDAGSALAYDMPALAAAADLLLVATYNENGPTGPPAPLDSRAGFADVLDRVHAVSRRRVAPIVGAIGYSWPSAGGSATMVSIVDAEMQRRRCRAQPVTVDGNASYTCRGRTVFHATGPGLRARARAVGSRGFRWVALFSLGREPLGFWRGMADVRATKGGAPGHR
jgi:spore germination protein YaaH